METRQIFFLYFCNGKKLGWFTSILIGIAAGARCVSSTPVVLNTKLSYRLWQSTQNAANLLLQTWEKNQWTFFHCAIRASILPPAIIFLTQVPLQKFPFSL